MEFLRAIFLVISLTGLIGAGFAAGLFAGVKGLWPTPPLKRIVAEWRNPELGTDQFGRLLRYPGKIAVPCPLQIETTAVLLVIGQSNAANYQGQRYQSPDDRVVNFSNGRCYRAASPLLGADGSMGETWTLLGVKLIQSGLSSSVVLIPAAVGGSPVHRWAEGGDLNRMLMNTVRSAAEHYTITAIIWDQGAEDFARHTPEDRYKSDLKSLIDSIRNEGVSAPFFITRCSIGNKNWSGDNPVARAQASLADNGAGVFDGPNTDRDLTRLDRYDDYHFGASGQEKYTDTLVDLLRTHLLRVPNQP